MPSPVLPFEILALVFSRVDDSIDLFCCCLVSRHWYHVALPFFNKITNLTDINVHKLTPYNLGRLAQVFVASRRYGMDLCKRVSSMNIACYEFFCVDHNSASVDLILSKPLTDATVRLLSSLQPHLPFLSLDLYAMNTLSNTSLLRDLLMHFSPVLTNLTRLGIIGYQPINDNTNLLSLPVSTFLHSLPISKPVVGTPPQQQPLPHPFLVFLSDLRENLNYIDIFNCHITPSLSSVLRSCLNIRTVHLFYPQFYVPSDHFAITLESWKKLHTITIRKPLPNTQNTKLIVQHARMRDKEVESLGTDWCY